MKRRRIRHKKLSVSGKECEAQVYVIGQGVDTRQVGVFW